MTDDKSDAILFLIPVYETLVGLFHPQEGLLEPSLYPWLIEFHKDLFMFSAWLSAHMKTHVCLQLWEIFFNHIFHYFISISFFFLELLWDKYVFLRVYPLCINFSFIFSLLFWLYDVCDLFIFLSHIFSFQEQFGFYFLSFLQGEGYNIISNISGSTK